MSRNTSTLRGFDLAHLAHLELLSPKPDESLNFFVNVMGMTETARRGDSVYLRGWDDYEHHTLKLTASKVAGMGHMAFRATRDRKSTRLNSSHPSISYAVFCLKKKKKNYRNKKRPKKIKQYREQQQ